MSKKRKTGKKNKCYGFLKKHWILLWLVTASLALITVVSFAAYKDANNRIKRVFVTAKQGTSFFTSNYLLTGANFNSVSFDAADEKKFGVYIRNYDPNAGGAYDGDITYTISASLAHKNCVNYDSSSAGDAAALQKWTSEGMEIEIKRGAQSITLSGNTLTGSISGIVLTGDDGRSVHEWDVKFTNIDLDSDYCVTITATPDGGLTPLLATLGIGSFPETNKEGWTCSISDDTKNQEKGIDTYDAFNYMIAGSGGTTLKFSYDATKLAPNPYFATYNTGVDSKNSYTGSTTSGRGDWKTIEITVQPNVHRYDLQMYKVDAASNSPGSWDVLNPANKQWVEFEVVQPQPQP